MRHPVAAPEHRPYACLRPNVVLASSYSAFMADYDIVGFWSYVHDDDEVDGGLIVRLAHLLEGEYSMITGRRLRIFVDRRDIAWGDEWRRRIDEALTGTFFIPIITPRYFQSDECRAELVKFAGNAQSLGVTELLLPLLYVEVDDLNEDSDDELKALVARTHYGDPWTALRLEDERSGAYRQAVHRLAERLVEIAESVRPPEERLGTHPGSESDPEPDEDDRGVVDKLADMEAALPLWTKTMEQFTPIMERIDEIMKEAVRRAERADAAGKGFAGRVAAAQYIGTNIAEPAEEFYELASRYGSELMAIDAGVLTFVRMVQEGSISNEEQDAAAEAFNTVRELVETSRTTAMSIDEFVATLDEMSRFSKHLREPVTRLQEGLRMVRDGQSVMDEWIQRIDAIDSIA